MNLPIFRTEPDPIYSNHPIECPNANLEINPQIAANPIDNRVLKALGV
jgi:hypothetical protein